MTARALTRAVVIPFLWMSGDDYKLCLNIGCPPNRRPIIAQDLKLLDRIDGRKDKQVVVPANDFIVLPVDEMKFEFDELPLTETAVSPASLLKQHQDAVQRLAEVPGLGPDSA